MCKSSLLFFLFFCCSGTLLAQEYLGNDLDFFQKKSKLYDRWLDAKGLGEYLKVGKVYLDKNGYELAMVLTIETMDLDSARAIWNGLKTQFSRENPGDEQLEGQLFTTFERLMEIPAAQGNIQIYYPHETGIGYSPCFRVWIWEEEGQIMKEVDTSFCNKAKSLNIAVQLPKVKKASSQATVRMLSKADASAVFDAIIRYARKRYEKVKFHGHDPKVQSVKKEDYRLSFVVNDLRREVLTEEEKSLWCDFVELWWGPCNDMRRERLEFTFNFIPTQEGFLLTGSLTGKFGSGIYKPRISGYMDMEPDFEEDFLVPYLEEFQNDLKQYLER